MFAIATFDLIPVDVQVTGRSFVFKSSLGNGAGEVVDVDGHRAVLDFDVVTDLDVARIVAASVAYALGYTKISTHSTGILNGAIVTGSHATLTR